MTTLAMRRPRPSLVLAAAVVLAFASQAGSILQGSARVALPQSPTLDSRPASVLPPDVAVGAPGSALPTMDQAIARWTQNLRRDPLDYISATTLGALYSSRARLTGNLDDYGRAQEAARQAIAAASSYTPARLLEATLLHATHDFAAAASAAAAIYASTPGQLQALASLGDSKLELGDYAGAEAAYATLQSASPGAAVTARLARLETLAGDPRRALEIADRSVRQAQSAKEAGAGLAWYRYLAGFIAFQAGDLAGAGARFGAALVDQPGSYLALNGLARVRAAEGRYADAIALYGRAVAIAPQPDALAALGDLYQLTGESKLADQQYATVRAIARLAAVNRQVYNRQLVLFDVNHGVNLAEALRLAEQELAVRKDIYGYDAVAWALLANGRAAEAGEVMAHALSLGTRDAQLLYHAGLIAQAVGDEARARTLLSDALALNPGFDPLQAVRARAALEELR